MTESAMRNMQKSLSDYCPEHFLWQVSTDKRVATITLNNSGRKNPLTFDSYAELTVLFRALNKASDIRVVIIIGAGGNFSSGGDVFDIIEPLTKMAMPDLLAFTRMTGDLVRAMRQCPQPIIAAVDGICAGAGAILAMVSDLRLATTKTTTAFLFTRVGLCGADMGACGILPRLIGLGRASELLLTGRNMSAQEGVDWGFYSRIVDSEALETEALNLAHMLADGPYFSHSMTKKMLGRTWTMELDTLLEAEAQAQAICMTSNDFQRAFAAFAIKKRPVFMGD